VHHIVLKMFILIQNFFSAAILQHRSTTLLPASATMANGVTNINPPPSSFGDVYLGIGANGRKVRLMVVHDVDDGAGGKRMSGAESLWQRADQSAPALFFRPHNFKTAIY
jgi:hypothetical protein